MTSTQKRTARGRFSGSIRARLAGIVALFAVALIATIAVLTWMEAGTIYTARQDELKTAVQVAYKVVERQYDEFKNGKITEAEAQERAKADVRAMRYNANDYFFVQSNAMLHHRSRRFDSDQARRRDPQRGGPHREVQFSVEMHKVAFEQIHASSIHAPVARSRWINPRRSSTLIKQFATLEAAMLGPGVYIGRHVLRFGRRRSTARERDDAVAFDDYKACRFAGMVGVVLAPSRSPRRPL